MISPAPGGFVLSVRVIPRAPRTELGGLRGNALVIRVKAPPVDGAANAVLVEFLSGLLQIPRSSIQIRHGGRGRLKTIAVAGLSVDAARAALLGPT